MNLLALMSAIMLVIVNYFNSFVGYFPIDRVEAASSDSKPIPILMFHHFVDDEIDCNSTATITGDKFNEVLDEISSLGYTCVSFKELIDYADSGKELPEKPILLTMDDGYKSNFEIAFPILKEKNMKALVSIIGKSTQYTSSYIENKSLPHVSWDELNMMIDSGVFEVGNHTFDMHEVTAGGGKRDGITKNFFESELEYSRAVREDISSLEKALEFNCDYENNVFCYPYGMYDELSEAVISGLGYKVTLTVDEGINYISPGDSLIGLKRINVDMSTEISDYLN